MGFLSNREKRLFKKCWKNLRFVANDIVDSKNVKEKNSLKFMNSQGLIKLHFYERYLKKVLSSFIFNRSVLFALKIKPTSKDFF